MIRTSTGEKQTPNHFITFWERKPSLFQNLNRCETSLSPKQTTCFVAVILLRQHLVLHFFGHGRNTLLFSDVLNTTGWEKDERTYRDAEDGICIGVDESAL